MCQGVSPWLGKELGLVAGPAIPCGKLQSLSCASPRAVAIGPGPLVGPGFRRLCVSPSFALQQLLKGKEGSQGTRWVSTREERGCGDGALPHGSFPGPSGHPPHAIAPSQALLAPYLKASQTFLLAKHLQLPHTRRSSQRRVIASSGPDVDRRHAPSPARASHPLPSLQTGSFALQKTAGQSKARSKIPLSINNVCQNLSYTWDGAGITLPGCRVGVHEPSLFLMAMSSAQCAGVHDEEATGWGCHCQKREPGEIGACSCSPSKSPHLWSSSR